MNNREKNPVRYEIVDRKRIEELELEKLAPYACKSSGAHETRLHPEPEHPYRTAFQRDRDRIIHSRAFRRLKHKRQVFLITEGDHYRTRLTHTLEVSQLSRTMSRALGLNEDLTEAIALGHDLGHTPFGHLGEVVLHDIMVGKRPLQSGSAGRDFGGFKHNYQSLRVVDTLEEKYQFPGLNITAPVREGILKHTRLKRDVLNYPDLELSNLFYDQDVASTFEAQVVAICDEIAQRTHDLEDGIRAHLVTVPQVQEITISRRVAAGLGIDELAEVNDSRYVSLLITGLINYLMQDVIQQTLLNLQTNGQTSGPGRFEHEFVTFSKETDPLQKELNKFIYQNVIDYSRVQWSDELAEELLFRLFRAYFEDPRCLQADVLAKYRTAPVSANDLPLSKSQEELHRMHLDPAFLRLICDHIAGMTDRFAVREANRLATANAMHIQDLDLDRVMGISAQPDR